MSNILEFKKRKNKITFSIKFDLTDDGLVWYKLVVDGIEKDWRKI